MNELQTLLVLIAAILVNAISAARTFYRSQQDAWVRTSHLGAAVQGYTLRVVSFLERHPELSGDPAVREALLPTVSEADAIQYSPSIAALLPEWRRGEGILSPHRFSPGLSAYVRGRLDGAVTGRMRFVPRPSSTGIAAESLSAAAEEVKP